MIGKCPERGTILVQDRENIIQWFDNDIDIRFRCPSCTKSFHSAGELEWETEQ